MTDVGVRELKRDLSGYLKRAAAGEPIRVTMRGEPIVVLTPAAPSDEPIDPIEAQWEALYASGRVKRALRRKSPFVQHNFRVTGSPVDAILEERAAEDE